MKAPLPQRLTTIWYGTRGRTGTEYAVDARRAHLVVAFWIYEELQRRVEVPIRLADGTYVL